MDDDKNYIIDTLSSPVEVLRIIGQNALSTVFVNTEILSLRNIRGEGCSLTHEEWEFMLPVLKCFPEELADFLLTPVSGASAREVPHAIQELMIDFVLTLLKIHPLKGNIKVCHKLIALCDLKLHQLAIPAAKILSKAISAFTAEEYKKILAKTDIGLLVCV